MDEEKREQFRRIVIKDDTSRLRAEIARARPHMTEAEVDDLTREELVEIITDLRLRTGETRSIKDPVREIEESAIGEIVQEERRPVETMVHMDPTQAMLQIILQMKREDGEKEARLIEEDRRRLELEGEKETRRIEEDRRRIEFEREKEEKRMELERVKEEKRMELERVKEEKRMEFEREKAEEERKLRREELRILQEKEEKKAEEDRKKEELRLEKEEKKAEEDRKKAEEERKLRKEEIRLIQELEREKAEEERKLRKEEMRLMLEREERKADEDSRREDFRMKIEEDRREEVKMEKDRCIEEQRRLEDAAERRHRETLEDNEKRANSRDMKMKRGADILRGCMYRMGDDVLEMPIFFENADRHFESNGIEDDLRLALISPYLSEKARRLLTRLSRDETDTYDKVKKALLTEFRLTPQKYRDML